MTPLGGRRLAADLYPDVWRTTLDRPGFALVPLPADTDSRALRRFMLDLVDGFGEASAAAGGERLVCERLGRFDQQVSSRFHRDGAPPASLLVLGYEPTAVRSRFWVADAHRAARDAGLGVDAYLSAHNPMTADGERRLMAYATELDLPHGEPFVVIVNNSLLPLDPGGANPLGVLHKATIPEPDTAARRVINSVGAMSESGPADRRKTAAEIEHFLTRNDLD